ncbi:transcriptional regulator [Desulfosarcina alkanivorans]|uniref:Transcriptional regulator n=1 Tax=Desulfosarcina alkanivorans TaxID=571177 RepID=A0A5K7YGK9_9BACT|nr:helix-turn-helix domain-containing protein [Desulfosarcina alkanivorans]BBO67703.1 transcriptional regulator [Desulfosarcina alkanivorans]
MQTSYNLATLGLSDYAIRTYLSLLEDFPTNGSQLSKRSGIPRARIYDVLQTLRRRGFVAEASKGTFVPLPPDELIKQLRQDHEKDLDRFKQLVDRVRAPADHDFIWTVTGYHRVLDKAVEMIESARREIYIRLFPQEAEKLVQSLKKAEKRAVQVKCIFMEPFPRTFAIQVTHPQHEVVERNLGGRSFDLVVDKAEFIGGLFTAGDIDTCRINWGRNRWFVTTGRDSLRHDFFHYFLYKIHTLHQPLDDNEKRFYEMIQNDM